MIDQIKHVLVMLGVTVVLGIVIGVYLITDKLGIGTRTDNELEAAMQRNAERTTDWDHGTFDETYFKHDDE